LLIALEPSPTEDAKASSALFNDKGFIGALGVLNFFKNTLRVLVIAVALGRLGFSHPQSLTDCR